MLPVQQDDPELQAAWAMAAPVLPISAKSRIKARMRFIAVSYHGNTPEDNKVIDKGRLCTASTIS